ncbi:halocyanin domain-containing protein [Halobacteriales archaeon SW_10_66_29]|nr:MAG: halocyanin domain-containing protein [Halobacteriales archaeon SW_10_66_29]
MDTSDTYTRRGLLRTGTGAAVGLAAAGATGTAGAQGSAYDGYLEDEGTWGGETVDATGMEQVTVRVGAQGNGGNFAFAPPWEWTGEGGGHNVVSEAGNFESDIYEQAGETFEYTFEEAGVEQYFCSPHKQQGMKGVVAVGEDNAEGDVVPFGAQPDFGGYLDDVPGFEGGAAPRRGQEEVGVDVGAGDDGFLFDPVAIHVDAGTTVVWEWTGNGAHNVVSEADEFESELTGEEGFTFEYTFEEAGIHRYYCNPHKGQGMKGAVVVGDEFPTLTGNVLRTGAVWAGAAVFGTVALLGVAAYQELFGEGSLTE